MTGWLERRADLYVRNLAEMTRLTRERNGIFLALIQSARPQNNLMRWYDERYDRFVMMAAEKLSRQSIPFLNLHAVSALRAEHFTDNIHFKPAGAEIAAEHVARHLLARGLF